MAACQPTRGFEYQTPPSSTPIVEPYHPTWTLTETPTPQPTLTPTPTVIPGPFESQPAIHYPSEEVVQGLGITNYQVVDNHYIALREVVDQQTGETHQYIIAQATTNKEGKFTGWQKTIPFAVETGLVVPHPQETNPELFDLKKSDAPLPQFVNAMEMAGIEVNPEEVANNLQYQVVTGADGKPYVIGAFNLDPDPNKKGKTLEGPIPLLMWSEEGWRETTPSNLGIMRGILVGTMSHPPGTGEGTYQFHEAKKGRFTSIITITDYWTAREKLEGSPNMTYIDKEIEEALNLEARTIRIAHLISHQQTPSWLEEKSGANFKTAVLNHIEQHMSYITDRTIRQAKAKGLSQITPD